MTAARYDLIIDQGSDFSLELTVKESGSAKSLSGWLASAQLRASKESASAAATFNATVQTPEEQGKITLALPYHISDDMTAGQYYYDLEIREAASAAASAVQVSRLIHGTATIRREVTR
jgi:hypothetical protein